MALTHNYVYTDTATGARSAVSDTLTAGRASYSYDQADRLIGFNAGFGSYSYGYDGDGLRQSKTLSGTTEAYTWDTAEGLPQLLQDGSTRYVMGPDGLPLEQVSGTGTVLYYYQDQLGSTRALLTGAAQLAGAYAYNAFGSVAYKSGSASTPFGYAGQYTDPETGFEYLQARYYDPATSQFLTPDPLVAVTGQPYAYAGDDPLNATDPTGLCKNFDPRCWAFALSAGLANFTNSSFANHATAAVFAPWNMASSVYQFTQRAPQELQCGFTPFAQDFVQTLAPLGQAALSLTPYGAVLTGQAQGQAWGQDIHNGDWGALGGDALSYAGMAGAGKLLGAFGEGAATPTDAAPMGKVPTDLYAFGNRSAPRDPRIAGFNLKPGQEPDLVPGANGMVGPTDPPRGGSTFGDPNQAPLTGHYHRLPAGTQLPEGLGIRADGSDVGGTQPPTHHTIYPTRDTPPADFVQQWQSLPWEYGGKK